MLNHIECESGHYERKRLSLVEGLSIEGESVRYRCLHLELRECSRTLRRVGAENVLGTLYPVKLNLVNLDKKHTKSWQILPRSCHGTYQENKILARFPRKNNNDMARYIKYQKFNRTQKQMEQEIIRLSKNYQELATIIKNY